MTTLHKKTYVKHGDKPRQIGHVRIVLQARTLRHEVEASGGHVVRDADGCVLLPGAIFSTAGMASN